jgi:hypothetical protein
MTEELPPGWHWGIGEVAGESETYWFYTNLRFHYRGELYTDPNQPWTVCFYEETGLRNDGDIAVSEYPTTHRRFEREADALDWIAKTATGLHNPFQNDD